MGAYDIMEIYVSTYINIDLEDNKITCIWCYVISDLKQQDNF